jgi:hypothetical protein
MRIPKQVKIGGHLYQISVIPELENDRGSAGESCARRLTINVDAGGAQTHQEEVFCHEIIEQWNYRCELGLSHDKTTIIGFLLHQFIVDNPQLLGDK